jgi:predicted nucleic acid-binding protein
LITGVAVRGRLNVYTLAYTLLSTLRRLERDAKLEAWFKRQRESDLFLSVVTIGEIERGIQRQRAANPEFARTLAAWLDVVMTLYGERILPFDLAAARRWGQLSARIGSNSPDLMIAATAREHGSIVATHNISHFEPTGSATIDPFGPKQAREK